MRSFNLVIQLVIQSSLSTQEVKRQIIANWLRAGVGIKRIAETRSLCEHRASNAKKRIQDIGGIKGKRESGGMNKNGMLHFLNLSRPKLLKTQQHPSKTAHERRNWLRDHHNCCTYRFLVPVIGEDPEHLLTDAMKTRRQKIWKSPKRVVIPEMSWTNRQNLLRKFFLSLMLF